MKRTFSALLLTLSLLISCTALPAFAAEQDAAVQTVKALGILVGDEQGNLNLNSNVTRAQFAKMLVSASPYRDSISPEGTGYSLFKDVKSSHWASEYIGTAVQNGWVVGYTDGTFRPDQTVTLEEACSAALRLLGYDSSTLAGSFPSAQLNKAAALGLREQIHLTRGGAMTRQDCAYLFYNLLTAQTNAGQTYAVTLGYTLTADGDVDYTAVLKNNLRGPYIAQSGSETLPITANTIYRNGTLSTVSTMNQYDVYYYNTGTGTAWIYTDRVSGKVTAVSPNLTTPTSVTVNGVSYSIGSATATYQLSSLSGEAVGSMVTLLLGMNGEVVFVLSGNAVDMTYYGIVLSSGKITGEKDAAVQTQVEVMCTDGISRTFQTGVNTTYEAGRLVSVSVSDGGTMIRGLSSRSTEGRINTDGTKFGNYSFAADVQILDITDAGNAVTVSPKRLAGHTLSTTHVRYYALDESGQISHLILKDATGDAWTYGYLISVSSIPDNTGGSSFGTTHQYQYIANGQTALYSSKTGYPVQAGAIGIQYNTDGTVKTMRSLTSAKLTSLSSASAMVDNKKYSMADNVQVYLRENGSYYPTTLSAVNTAGYKLTGWYDTAPAGGQIRVIIAQK